MLIFVRFLEVAFAAMWSFGALLIAWTLYSVLRHGVAFHGEAEIRRDKKPVQFWVIVFCAFVGLFLSVRAVLALVR